MAMGMIIKILPPKGPRLHPSSPVSLRSIPTNLPKPRARSLSHCSNSINDAELAAEVRRMNTHLVQREEAMEKSRKLLFTDMCKYLGMRSEEAKRRWGKMGEEEKWVLVIGFVSECAVNFHPLYAKSVKETVEEHLNEDGPSPHPSSLSPLFPGLKWMFMGFQSDK